MTGRGIYCNEDAFSKKNVLEIWRGSDILTVKKMMSPVDWYPSSSDEE